MDAQQTRTAPLADKGALDATLAPILARHAAREGPLLPILHDVQRSLGWIPDDAVTAIATALNLSRAEVSGVVGFYHDFRRSAPTRPAIRLCGAEACQARGGRALRDHAVAHAGARVEVATVYCLGLCSVGPAALVGGDVHARLTPAHVAALIDGLAP
jgi:formate dehydrogenase subunit gamma